MVVLAAPVATVILTVGVASDQGLDLVGREAESAVNVAVEGFAFEEVDAHDSKYEHDEEEYHH